MRNIRRVGHQNDNPLQGIANLFDLGIVFALGFIITLLSYLGLSEMMQKKDFTLVKNPGEQNMEIVIKKGETLKNYQVSQKELSGTGEKLGMAYRLKSGEVVYVPAQNRAPENKNKQE